MLSDISPEVRRLTLRRKGSESLRKMLVEVFGEMEIPRERRS